MRITHTYLGTRGSSLALGLAQTRTHPLLIRSASKPFLGTPQVPWSLWVARDRAAVLAVVDGQDGTSRKIGTILFSISLALLLPCCVGSHSPLLLFDPDGKPARGSVLWCSMWSPLSALNPELAFVSILSPERQWKS